MLRLNVNARDKNNNFRVVAMTTMVDEDELEEANKDKLNDDDDEPPPLGQIVEEERDE